MIHGLVERPLVFTMADLRRLPSVSRVHSSNGVIDADTVMTEKTLPAVQMPNRDGFVADPRPDVSRP
jgi:hypothetical protein